MVYYDRAATVQISGLHRLRSRLPWDLILAAENPYYRKNKAKRVIRANTRWGKSSCRKEYQGEWKKGQKAQDRQENTPYAGTQKQKPPIFWICTSTEAWNQPHFPDDDVLLLSRPCCSFKPSFVNFGWHNYFFLFPWLTLCVFVFWCHWLILEWYITNST